MTGRTRWIASLADSAYNTGSATGEYVVTFKLNHGNAVQLFVHVS